jgi:hypothetical protein
LEFPGVDNNIKIKILILKWIFRKWDGGGWESIDWG